MTTYSDKKDKSKSENGAVKMSIYPHDTVEYIYIYDIDANSIVRKIFLNREIDARCNGSWKTKEKLIAFGDSVLTLSVENTFLHFNVTDTQKDRKQYDGFACNIAPIPSRGDEIFVKQIMENIPNCDTGNKYSIVIKVQSIDSKNTTNIFSLKYIGLDGIGKMFVSNNGTFMAVTINRELYAFDLKSYKKIPVSGTSNGSAFVAFSNTNQRLLHFNPYGDKAIINMMGGNKNVVLSEEYVFPSDVKFINDSSFLVDSKFQGVKKFSLFTATQDSTIPYGTKFFDKSYVTDDGSYVITIPKMKYKKSFGKIDTFPNYVELHENHKNYLIWSTQSNCIVSSFARQKVSNSSFEYYDYGEFAINKVSNTLFYMKKCGNTPANYGGYLESRNLFNGNIIKSKNTGHFIDIIGHNVANNKLILKEHDALVVVDPATLSTQHEYPNALVEQYPALMTSLGSDFYENINDGFISNSSNFFLINKGRGETTLSKSLYKCNIVSKFDEVFLKPRFGIPYEDPIVSHNGKFVAARLGKFIYLFVAESSNAIDSIEFSSLISKYAFSDDDQMLVVANISNDIPNLEYILLGNSKFKHKDIWTQFASKCSFISRGIRNLSISPNGKYAVVSLVDQNMYAVFNLDIQKFAYYLIPYDKSEYLVVDEDGHYDGTDDALRKVYFIGDRYQIMSTDSRIKHWVKDLGRKRCISSNIIKNQ